ncbi:copper chaperone PCu(A)C [Sphingopyxis sp. KK2]|uniref:copper chaperone PCu(A)C n=1 Tax=Sphingopyxis sp. KK2 TaxID=1855727 RepID=UPI00097E64E7|nr:copper chaperone PCu(A)C [Sphingopyxis sp. KK2]
MNRFARRLFLGATLAATALTLAGCEENLGKGPVLHISGGEVRMGATPDRPAVGYFTVKGGDAPVDLVAVSADLAQRIEMHESVKEGGMMTMKPIERAAVPARGRLEFKQGGKHLMIWGVNPAAVREGKLSLVFMFTNNDRIVVDLPIKNASTAAAADGAAMDHGAMDHGAEAAGKAAPAADAAKK